MIQNKVLSIYTSNSSCQIFSTKELDRHTVDKEMHRHSYYQILVLKKGEIRHFLDYSLQESRAPYLSVVFPNQVHQIELSPDAELSLIAFDSSVFCAAIIANELQDYNIDLQARINHIHPKDNYDWVFILQILEQIKHLSRDLNAIKKMEVKFLIKVLLLKSIEIAPCYYPLGKSDSDVQFYVRFRELVNKNFHQQYKVQDYAAELGISTKTLNAFCRRYTGKNPLEIIHEKLGLELKRSILEDGLLLKELAFKFGFSSQSALNKFIEKEFGCSPQNWKEKLKKGLQGL